jgi:DnaK suppressor protein
MEELSKALLAEFEHQLQNLKLQIEQESTAAKDSSATVELDQQSVGRLSRMDAMQSQQMAMELARRRQRSLVLINEALNRIKRCDYGYCVSCEELIDIRRLQVNPTATFCVKCADVNA